MEQYLNVHLISVMLVNQKLVNVVLLVDAIILKSQHAIQLVVNSLIMELVNLKQEIQLAVD
jgi:hypothetical protein